MLGDWRYIYSAQVTKVYDGDTITVDIDLGMSIVQKDVKLRLAWIDTPEVRGEERPEGLKVRDWLREQILGKEVFIHTIKDRSGKYGRLLAIVETVNGVNINSELLRLGYAEPFMVGE